MLDPFYYSSAKKLVSINLLYYLTCLIYWPVWGARLELRPLTWSSQGEAGLCRQSFALCPSLLPSNTNGKWAAPFLLLLLYQIHIQPKRIWMTAAGWIQFLLKSHYMEYILWFDLVNYKWGSAGGTYVPCRSPQSLIICKEVFIMTASQTLGYFRNSMNTITTKEAKRCKNL